MGGFILGLSLGLVEVWACLFFFFFFCGRREWGGGGGGHVGGSGGAVRASDLESTGCVAWHKYDPVFLSFLYSCDFYVCIVLVQYNIVRFVAFVYLFSYLKSIFYYMLKVFK